MQKKKVATGTLWEEIVGYSRAVRVGNVVEIAGTTAVEDGEIVGIGNAYAQAKCIFRKIERALHAVGASMNDVVRTRVYLTEITTWNEVGKAHGEFFRDIRPVTSMVEVSALIDPALLVEIEVTAILTNE
ncbi:MAG: RidA family protein [Bernardetiaceae bacterium]|nr:RidA family protein [Bernardetiaceae bacterium]